MYGVKRGKRACPTGGDSYLSLSNTETRKTELFGMVRAGQIRFLLGSTQKMGAGTNVQDRLIALHHLDIPWRPADIEQQEGRILRQGNMNDKVKIFRYVTEGTFDSYSWQVIENKQKFISQIMTSKSPVRSCEDIDETALSYAEVKALATGNPYIREKMDLDVQVSRLRLLKANHDSQRYRLEDNIARHYPEKIAALKWQAEGFRLDIQLHEQNRPQDKEEFSMRIGSLAFTDRKEAGTALINICRNVETPETAVAIGEYRGFRMSCTYSALFNKFTVRLKGSLSHEVEIGPDPSGNLRRLDNALEALPGKLADLEQKLANVERQLENAKAEAAKPFPKEAELSEKTARLHELNALLNMDEKAEPVFLEEGQGPGKTAEAAENTDGSDISEPGYTAETGDEADVPGEGYAAAGDGKDVQNPGYVAEASGMEKLWKNKPVLENGNAGMSADTADIPDSTAAPLSVYPIQGQGSHSAAGGRVSIKEKMAAMREPRQTATEKGKQLETERAGTASGRKERISVKDKIARIREKDGQQGIKAGSRNRQRQAVL